MSGFFGQSSATIVSSDGYQGLAQTLFTELTEDGYTIAREPNFATLLSQSIVTSGGNLVINFSASFGANTSISGVIFRVLLDGVLQRSVSTGFSGEQQTQSVSITVHRTVTSDIHNIDIQWGKSIRDNKFSTIYILAGTETNTYHASLLVQEVE